MSSLTDVLKKIAPTVATVLGGPFAGLALEILGPALGLEGAAKDKITDMLTGGNLNAEQVAAIKIAEINLVAKLKELDIKLEEIEVKKEEVRTQDRISARTLFDRGFKLISALAILTIVGFFWSIYQVMTVDLSGMAPEQVILVGTVIGYLAANTQQIYSYFFGSSDGSTQKNDMLAALVKNGNGKNSNGH